MKTTFVLALTAAAGAASAGLVDDFTQGAFDESTRFNGDQMLVAANALGGMRYLSWDIVDNPLNSRISLSTALGGGGDGLSVDMGAANAAVVSTAYGSLDSAASNLDYDASSMTSLDLEFVTVDLDVDVTVRLITADGSGTGAAGTAEASVLVNPGLNQSISVDLTGATISGSFDMADVDRVEVVFNAIAQEPNRDFFLSSISFVPAPGVGMLLGAAGLAGLRVRRR